LPIRNTKILKAEVDKIKKLMPNCEVGF